MHPPHVLYTCSEQVTETRRRPTPKAADTNESLTTVVPSSRKKRSKNPEYTAVGVHVGIYMYTYVKIYVYIHVYQG